MKVKPVISDSLGARSMATYVETKDVRIFIDPGVALGPKRYGLPPHRKEYEAMMKAWREILKLAMKSEVIVITHYHYDHHNPWKGLEIYEGKLVLIKHPTRKINFSQRKRAAFFLEQIEPLAKQIEYADGKKYEFDDTRIALSEPVPHGINAKLGYVIEVCIDDGFRFVHTSDVEGPALPEQVEFIWKCKPDLVYVDGPLSYIMRRYGKENLAKSVSNLKELVKEFDVIVDHHFLRDLKWQDIVAEVFKASRASKHFFGCLAQFLGKPVNMLEAHRKELFAAEKAPAESYLP